MDVEAAMVRPARLLPLSLKNMAVFAMHSLSVSVRDARVCAKRHGLAKIECRSLSCANAESSLAAEDAKISPLIHGKPGQVTLTKLINTGV